MATKTNRFSRIRIETPPMNSIEKMKAMASEAAGLVSGDRNRAYGEPLENHGCLAEYWTTHLKRRKLLKTDATLNAHDVCCMMSLLKLDREAYLPSHDNRLDAIGYMLNAEACAEPPYDMDFPVLRSPANGT